MTDAGPKISGGKLLLTLAALVVVIAGLKAAGEVVLPFLAAAFLAILAIPPMRALQRRGLPDWAAIAIVVAVATVLLLLITAYVGAAAAKFRSNLDVYKTQVDAVVERGMSWLRQVGLVEQEQDLADLIDGAAVMDFVTAAAAGLLGTMSNLIVIVLTMVFILLEATSFRGKLRRAIGSPDAELGSFARAADSVHDYLLVKASISLMNAVLVVIINFLFGTDFAILWGLVTFLFNFVPNIGSVLSSVPAVLMNLLEFGFGRALGLAVCYIAIEVIVGNAIEPRMMGRRLGLSTLVVWLSLMFWGWVWGPTGMLLSVPLTVIMKIMLEHTRDLRWLAVMLGPADEPEPAAVKPAPVKPPPPDDGDGDGAAG